MGEYSCPYCGWGEQRGHGQSVTVEITIKNGELACADPEEWQGEIECEECGKVYIVVYPPIQT